MEKHIKSTKDLLDEFREQVVSLPSPHREDGLEIVEKLELLQQERMRTVHSRWRKK